MAYLSTSFSEMKYLSTFATQISFPSFQQEKTKDTLDNK